LVCVAVRIRIILVTQQLPQPIQFGKYTLFERLGRGGMADVFKGRIQGPEGFERIFVVKRILPHLSDDPTFIRMFIEEAKLSARLNHPNIVQIFELGAVEGEYFISMEYVHGQDLSATMRVLWKSFGPPHPALVSFVGREVCRALGYAHGLTDEQGRPLGMIHRDVSPSNVMLSYDGAVKLLDFGIAKAMGDAPEITRNGTMKGKYAYMAPEQTEREEVDHRIDIFAAGIILYESLTGRRLFKGATDIQTIERVRRCDVKPPSFLNPACPPELDDILLKALARDPGRRFQTAVEMAEALDDLVHATRFSPEMLAGTMRHAFGLDGGIAPPVGEPRRFASGATGSIATPSASAPSPTIPPVAHSRRYGSAEPSTSQGAPSTMPDAAVIGTLLVKPVWTRGSFWLVVVLCVAGVGFAVHRGVLSPGGAGAGSAFGPSVGAVPGTGQAPSRRKVKPVPVLLQSYPEGAEIFVSGRLETVGVTPMWFGLELDAANPPRVMYRKVGFQDKAIAVETVRPPVADLIPNAAPPTVAPSAGAAGLDHAPRPFKLMRVKLPMPNRPSGPGPAAAGANTTGTPPATTTAFAPSGTSGQSITSLPGSEASPPKEGSPEAAPAVAPGSAPAQTTSGAGSNAAHPREPEMLAPAVPPLPPGQAPKILVRPALIEPLPPPAKPPHPSAPPVPSSP
jgi:serine/threonine protein kinase